MKKRISITLFLFCFLGAELLAQEVMQDYVIVSFERARKGSPRSVFHWIMSLDDIDNYSVRPLHLPITNTSKQESKEADSTFLSMIKFPKGETMLLFSGNIWDDINGWYSEDVDVCIMNNSTPTQSVISAVERNGHVVQVFKKKWSESSFGKGVENLSRQPETIKVLATPVKGVFVQGWKYYFNEDNLPIATYSLCPISSIIYNPHFWETEKGVFVKYADFSTIPFWGYSPNYSTNDNIGLGIIHHK